MKTNKKIETNDLEVGTFVTILSSVNEKINRGYKGSILKIIKIDYPFIVVSSRAHGKYGDVSESLDVRENDFKLLSNDYVFALQPSWLNK